MELNPTQLKYPLSRRKFWKKMITHGIALALLFFIATAVVTVIFLGVGSAQGTAGFYISTILVGILLFIAAFTLLYFVPYGLYVHYYIQTYVYSLDDDFITIKKGPITPAEIHVQYQKIQDVYVDQDLWDRILGIYDVHIASATVSSAMDAHIDGVNRDTAHALKEEILAKVTGRHPGMHQASSEVAKMTAGGAGEGNVQARPTFTPPSGVSTMTYPISVRWLISSSLSIFLGTVVFLIYLWFAFSDQAFNLSSGLGYYAILIIALTLGRLGYLIWWRSNYFFEFQANYIVLKNGVISTEEKHVPYDSVQDVNLNQSVLDRIFGICNVLIQNAAAMQQVVPQKYGMTAMGKNGITIPGLLLSDGKKLVEIVNGITIQKNSTRSEKGV